MDDCFRGDVFCTEEWTWVAPRIQSLEETVTSMKQTLCEHVNTIGNLEADVQNLKQILRDHVDSTARELLDLKTMLHNLASSMAPLAN